MMTSNIHWLGHASFRVDGKSVTVYFDPWEINNPKKADIILVTHDHYDHCSSDDIKKISSKETVIVTTASAAKTLSGNIKVVKPGDEVKVKGIPIKIVPSYNTNKAFHPKSAGNAGFLITVDGVNIYHAGDTDVIPEMSSIKTDIALLPVSGTYVMTADEAAEAAKTINPKIAIPMHIGKGIGSLDDRLSFKKKSKVPTEIFNIEK